MMENPPFTCPYCETEIALPEDVWYFTCLQCNHRLDLKAQFAYLRGLDAFSAGQEIMEKISPRKRHPDDPRIKEAMLLFRKAYSSIQVAFLFDLAEAQRSLGVEMMSSMATEFMKWNMVSITEMSYWKSLMVEQTAQQEYDKIKTKLAGKTGPVIFLRRIRWQLRQRQLVKALADMDKRLKALEHQMEFVDIPRARNEKWKP